MSFGLSLQPIELGQLGDREPELLTRVALVSLEPGGHARDLGLPDDEQNRELVVGREREPRGLVVCVRAVVPLGLAGVEEPSARRVARKADAFERDRADVKRLPAAEVVEVRVGAIEFGRIFLRLHVMTNAARDGARAATLPGRSTADITTAVEATLASVGLTADEFTITPVATDEYGNTLSDVSDAEPGDTVKVTLSHDFDLLMGSLIPGLSDSIALEQSCTFAHE